MRNKVSKVLPVLKVSAAQPVLTASQASLASKVLRAPSVPKVLMVLTDKTVFQESAVHEVTLVLLANLAPMVCLVKMVSTASPVSEVSKDQWAILADVVFLVSQAQLDLKVLLVSLVARYKMIIINRYKMAIYREKTVSMVSRVNQVSAASRRLVQVLSVHEVHLEQRVTKEPLASAFRVKSVHKVNLVSLVKLVFQVSFDEKFLLLLYVSLVKGDVGATGEAGVCEQACSPQAQVSFMAALSQNFIERGDAITFDTVLTNQNEAGNQPAYDQETGSFNAPVDGTYIFHVNVLLRFSKFIKFIFLEEKTVENRKTAMPKLWTTFCPLDEKPGNGFFGYKPGRPLRDDFMYRRLDSQEG